MSKQITLTKVYRRSDNNRTYTFTYYDDIECILEGFRCGDSFFNRDHPNKKDDIKIYINQFNLFVKDEQFNILISRMHELFKIEEDHIICRGNSASILLTRIIRMHCRPWGRMVISVANKIDQIIHNNIYHCFKLANIYCNLLENNKKVKLPNTKISTSGNNYIPSCNSFSNTNYYIRNTSYNKISTSNYGMNLIIPYNNLNKNDYLSKYKYSNKIREHSGLNCLTNIPNNYAFKIQNRLFRPTEEDYTILQNSANQMFELVNEKFINIKEFVKEYNIFINQIVKYSRNGIKVNKKTKK